MDTRTFKDYRMGKEIMKIHVLSDLHLEIAPYDKELPNADILILAGDILTASELQEYRTDKSAVKTQQNVNSFFTRISDKYETIFYICGNHEFYKSEYHSAYKFLGEWLETNYPKIKLFNNNVVNFMDQKVVFIGSTLWADFNNGSPFSMHDCKYGINDFRLIKYNNETFSPDICLSLFNENKIWLQHQIDLYKDSKVVVFTHHAPSKGSIHPRFVNDTNINGYFCSNLEYIISDNIKYWIHGHTHDSFDYMVGNTKVVCNPRGYGRTSDENKQHSENLILEV